MHSSRAGACTLILGAVVGACAHNPRPATPTPQPAPPAARAAPSPAPAPAPDPAADLSGDWRFSATLSGETVTGDLTLTRTGDTYAGRARTEDGNTYRMTSLTRTGQNVVMVFEVPEGAARVECTLSGGAEMSGALLMGQATGTFTAHRK